MTRAETAQRFHAGVLATVIAEWLHQPPYAVIRCVAFMASHGVSYDEIVWSLAQSACAIGMPQAMIDETERQVARLLSDEQWLEQLMARQRGYEGLN